MSSLHARLISYLLAYIRDVIIPYLPSHLRVRSIPVAIPFCSCLALYTSVVFSYLAPGLPLASPRASYCIPLPMQMQLCPDIVTGSAVLYYFFPFEGGYTTRSLSHKPSVILSLPNAVAIVWPHRLDACSSLRHAGNLKISIIYI